MKFFSLFFFLSLLCSNGYYAQTEIKSLQWGEGSDFQFPVIYKHSEQKLFVSFDVEGEKYPEFAMIFKFCDRNWHPYTSVFLQAEGKNIFYDMKFVRLPASVQGADYHFTGSFPNEDIEFPFSGRWRFFVTSLYDTADIYTWGEFYVVENSVGLSVTAEKSRHEGRISKNTALDRTYEMRVTVALPVKFHPTWFKGLEIIENRKIEYPVIIDKTSRTETKYYEMEDVDKFTFVWKNIHPGNEYRSLDIRDENKFPVTSVPINYHTTETDRFYELGKEDENGLFRLKDFNDYYSDYVDVRFNLRADYLRGKDVFIVGAFNYWEVLPEYKMNYKDGLYTFNTVLKRGKYDYQYVTLLEESPPDSVDWYEVEGNFWETTNEYHIFVNYDSQDLGGYDEIIGHYKFILNENGKD